MTIKLGLVGTGTVGGGCIDILQKHKEDFKRHYGIDVELVRVCSRDPEQAEAHGVSDLFTLDYHDIVNDPDIDIVIELIGGTTVARDVVVSALEAGKNVVTANKALMATHGEEVMHLAEKMNRELAFEASVGGGIPVLHPLSQCLGANEIYEVRGILNGTTNFILTQMLEHGQSYEAALRDAQTRGYAEQDPTADVEGIDAGRKVCILADMMFGKNVDPSRVRMTGISAITAEDAAFAEAAGMKLRLLGRAVRQGQALTVFVSPHFIAGTQPLAPVSGVLNAVEVLGSSVGAVMFSGPGAGGPATASAVLADVIDIVRNPGRSQPVSWPAEPAVLCDPEEFESPFFFRTRLSKEACEQALGPIRWLPDAGAFCGGFTEKTTRKALRASGLTLDAVWPVLE